MNSMPSRMLAAYRVVRRTFGVYVTPLITVNLFAALRISVWFGMMLDNVFFPRLWKTEVKSPIVLVGNPRTGTTFLQRFLSDHGIGGGQRLWRMLYPSLFVQFFLKPFLPILEKISPARHHSTAAHKTSLTSVETDDVSVLFRHFDGFFLYGFFLAFDEEDHRDAFQPEFRDTAARDFKWLRKLWRRTILAEKHDRIVGKLFSLAPRLPAFLGEFPDAKILYMARDPLAVIPSGMSLVTGVLDKRFGFWNLPEDVRARYLERLYNAFVELFRRFHADWVSGKIDRDNVYVVRYDRMMKDFDGMMAELLAFIDHPADEALSTAIAERADKQRAYVSKHKYDLEKFHLDADRIRQDCGFFYDTFLPPMEGTTP
jgi:LPS sulfotransferase NodH